MADEHDDVEVLTSDIDKVGPWQIKAIAGRARATAVMAARAEGVSVGVWLERRIMGWVNEPPPDRVQASNPDDRLEQLARIANVSQMRGGVGAALRRAILTRVNEIAPPPPRPLRANGFHRLSKPNRDDIVQADSPDAAKRHIVQAED